METLIYVINAPYFWLSMGMTTAVAIFVGAIIYDGDLSSMWKGVISVVLYAVFVFQVTYTRITDIFIRFPERYEATRYGGLLSLGFVTAFWMLGMALGVATSYLVRKNKIKILK